jgi:predicted nuclease of predicted toxin-antitoxin system
MKFLADESCDFTVVRALRSAGYDVVSIAETQPATSDLEVLRISVKDKRILLTEDKDFGEWVYAHREAMSGVILIRFPGNLRSKLRDVIYNFVEKHGSTLEKNFTVLEPGRARVHRST